MENLKGWQLRDLWAAAGTWQRKALLASAVLMTMAALNVVRNYACIFTHGTEQTYTGVMVHTYVTNSRQTHHL